MSRVRHEAVLLVGLGLLLFGCLPYFERLMNANERPRILQAIAVVDGGSLAIDGPAARGIKPGPDVSRSPDGRLYPNKPPGATVPAVIGYAGLRVFSSEVTLGETTAVARLLGGLVPLLVLVFMLRGRLRRRFGPEVADVTILLLVLATPLCSYGRLLFGHALSACLLTGGALLIIDALEGRAHRAELAAAGGGALAASAVLVEYGAAFAGLAVATYLAIQLRGGGSRRTVAAAVLGALVPIAALLGYHAAVFGDPLSTPYHHVVDEGFREIHSHGLLGLSFPTGATVYEHVFSPWGGLVFWAPLCIVGAVAGVLRSREDAGERLLVSIFIVMLAINLGLIQKGGWRVGPRYLVVAMPCLAYGLAHAVQFCRERPLPFALLVGVAGFSLFTNALAANLFPHVIPAGGPVGDQLLPLLIDGYEPHNLLRDGLGVAGVAIPVVLIVSLAWPAFALRRIENLPRARLATWAAAAALALGLLLATLRLPTDPYAEENVKAIEGMWEPHPDRPDPPPRVLSPFTKIEAPNGG